MKQSKLKHPDFRTIQAAQLYIAANDLPGVEPCPIYAHDDETVLHYAILPLRKRYRTTTEVYEQLADAGIIEVQRLLPDLLTHIFPAFRYAWAPYFPLRSTAGLIAQGGTGKTELVIEEMLHSAAGLPYMGSDTMQGLNVYIGCEDDLDLVQRKAQRIVRTFSAEAQQLALANFVVIDGVGKGLQFVIAKDGMVAIAPTVDRIIAAVRAVAAGRSVVHCAVDTVSRVLGASENDNNVMAAVEQAGSRIAQALDCACSLLHHTNKAVADKGTADLHSGRGGGAFGDNCRSVLRLMPLTAQMVKFEKLEGLDRAEVERGDILKLVHAKLNQDRRADPVYLRRTEGGLLVKITPSVRSDVQAKNDEMVALIAWYRRTEKPFTVTHAARTARIEWTKMTKTAATAFVEEAVHAGLFVAAETAGRGGGVQYVPSADTIAEYSPEDPFET